MGIMFRIAAETIVAATDQFFAQVSLLINGETGSTSTNNGAFVDSSTNNVAITGVGTSTQGAFSPVTGGGSIYLNGTTDYLTTPAANAGYAFGTGDFTVETWIYPTATGQRAFISNNYAWSTGAGNWALYGNVGGATPLYFNSSSGNRASTVNATLPVNTWTHIAYTRTGSVGRFFINGVQLGANVTDVSTYASTTGVVYIGQASNGLGKFAGYISNMRVVKGTALYTANFTTSTTPLTAISGTSLLLSGTNGAIVDATGKNNLVVIGATAQGTTFKYGTKALQFDGTTGYAYTPGTTQNFAFGTGDLTVEAWIYTNSLAATQNIYDSNLGGDTSGTGRLLIDITVAGTVRAMTNAGTTTLTQTSTGAITTGTWYHVAIVRASGVWKIYINGTASGTPTTNAVNLIANLNRPAIGANGYNLSSKFNGYMDEFRVTKGVARYTANFTAPTAPFPII